MEQSHYIRLSTYSRTLALSSGGVTGVRVLVSGSFLNINALSTVQGGVVFLKRSPHNSLIMGALDMLMECLCCRWK